MRRDHVLEADAAAVETGAGGVLLLLTIEVEHRQQAFDALDVRDAVGRGDQVAAAVDAVAERPCAATADRIGEHIDERLAIGFLAGQHGHIGAAVAQSDHFIAQVFRTAVQPGHRLPHQVAG